MSYTITTKTQLVAVTIELTGDQVARLAEAAPYYRALNADKPSAYHVPILELLDDLERIHAANSSAPRPTKGRKPRSQAPIGG